MRNKFIGTIIFFIGYALSPFSFWNDAFVNLPIAYFFASIAASLLQRYFLESFIFFYWLSNIFGIYLMVISGSEILKEKFSWKKMPLVALNVFLYTVLIGVLAYFKLLAPLRF